MQEKLLTPLGMHESGFWAPPDRRHRLMSLYGKKAKMTPGHLQLFPIKGDSANPEWVLLDRATDSSLATSPKWTSPGGGIVTTMEEYQFFINLLVTRGVHNGVRLLSESSISQMMTQQLWGDLETCKLPSHPMFVSQGIGYGFGVGQYLRPPHTQKDIFGSGAANTFFLLNYEKQVSAFFVTQLVPFDSDSFFLAFRERIHEIT